MRASRLILILMGALLVGVPQKGFSQSLCRSVYQAAPALPIPGWARLETASEREAHLVETFKRGSKTFRISRDLAHGLQALPSSAREAWLFSIGRAYRQVPKKDPNPTASWHIGGRRLLDRALMLLQRHDLAVRVALNEQTPRQVLGAFFERQNQLFGTRYGLSEVEPMISYLQQKLRDLPASGPALKVTLGGSFINGKADLRSSDLDLSVSDRHLVREVPDWQRDLAALLRQTQPESNLTIEAHGEPKYFYGKINPIVIEISAQEVRVFVFAPARESGAELQAAEPFSFLLL